MSWAPNVFSPNLRFIFDQLRRQRRLLIASISLMLVAAAIEPVIPALMKPLLDQTIPNRGNTGSLLVPLMIFLAFVARGVVDYLSSLVAQKISQLAVHQIRSDLFSAITSIPFGHLKKADPGFYASKVLNDVGSISGALSTVWITLVKDSLVVVLLLAYLLYTSATLTILIFLTLPLAALLVRKSSAKIRSSSKNIQEHSANLNSALVDYLSPTGLRDIYTLGIQNFARARFSDLSTRLATETITLSRRQATIVPLVQVIAALGVCIAIALAVTFPMGLDSPGEFVSFMAAMAMIFEPIKRLTNLNTVIQRGLVGVESVREVLLEGGAQQRHKPTSTGLLFKPDSISLKITSKVHDGHPILGPIKLELNSGRFIGLKGLSGSGKSSLAMIFARLDGSFEGEITSIPIPQDGGNDVWPLVNNDFCTPLFPGLLYLGPQPMIFADTLINNVSFGTDVSENHDRTRRSLEHAGLTHLANSLEIQVGCGGRALSAGESQRLAFARVFYFRPRFLIIDEATGSLDEMTERNLMEELKNEIPLLGGLIISHRETTYKYVDQIYLLESGKIKS